MKRTNVVLTVFFCLFFILSFSTVVFAENKNAAVSSHESLDKPIEIVLDHKPLVLDVPPIIREGRTLVPFRAIGEALGATVGWEKQTLTVTLKWEEKEIVLRIGEQKALVNGREYLLDVPALIVDGRTLVPLRFISESLGRQATWIPESKRVEITSSEASSKAEDPTGDAAQTVVNEGWIELQQLAENLDVSVTGLLEGADIIRLRHPDGSALELYRVDQDYYETPTKEPSLLLIYQGGRFLLNIYGLQQMGWINGTEAWLKPVSIPEARPVGSYLPAEQLTEELGIKVTRLPAEHSVQLYHPDGTTLLFSRAERGLSASHHNILLQMIIQDGHILLHQYGLERMGWLEGSPAAPLPDGDWISLQELATNYGIGIAYEGSSIQMRHPDGTTIVFSSVHGGFRAVHRGETLNIIVHAGQTLADRSAFQKIGWLDNPLSAHQPAPANEADTIPEGEWIILRQWAESAGLSISLSFDDSTAKLNISGLPTIMLIKKGRVYEGEYRGTTLRVSIQSGTAMIDSNSLKGTSWP